MHQVAGRDLDYLETHASDAERVETAVAATVLFEPVLHGTAPAGPGGGVGAAVRVVGHGRPGTWPDVT